MAEALADSIKAMYNYHALVQFFNFMEFFMIIMLVGYPVFRVTNQLIDSEKMLENTYHKRNENSAKERVDETSE